MKIRIVIARVSIVAVAAGLLISAVACNKDSSNASVAPPAPGAPPPGGGQPTIAQVPGAPYPNAGECLSRVAPQAGWWPQYGAQPYGAPLQGYGQPQFNPFPQGTICGCPPGYMPTCSPQGLMCMPMRYMNYNVVAWRWGQGGFERRHWVVNPYTRWHRRPPGGRGGWARSTFDFDELQDETANMNGSCSINSVAQLCSLAPGAVQPTYPGMYCMPLQPGSPWGVWIRQ